MRALATLLVCAVLVGACAQERAIVPANTTPTATPSGPPPSVATPAATTARPATADVPLFDAHVHYSQDAWTKLTPDEAVAVLRGSGVRRALVSSTPDEGTMRLYARAPDLVIPILRPYRTRDDIGTWTRDGTVVAYLEATYRRGAHRGIGEFHLGAGEAALPVVRAVVAMAVREDLILHAHADARAIEELLRIDARARVLWAHAGMSESAATVGALVDRYPNLYVELALRTDVAPGGVLDPTWRALLVRRADRLMIGTDTWVPSRWDDLPAAEDAVRVWLAQLPPDAAAQIASGNGDRLFPR